MYVLIMSTDGPKRITNDPLKLNPYNPNNILIRNDDLLSIFQICELNNIPIYDLQIYQNAFVHKSYITSIVNGENVSIVQNKDSCIELQPESNERLEFLGDSVIDLAVVSYIYKRFYDADEGFMTKLKTRLVKTNTLAMCSKYLGLEKYLIISKHVEEKCNGRTNNRILEDLFESFIGAMFKDLNNQSSVEKNRYDLFSGPGYEICEKIIISILENTIDFEQLIINDENYKDILLRYYQHQFQITPKYIEVEMEGVPHKRSFIMGVLDKDNVIVGKGKAKSKKEAEQIASKNALIYFGEL